MQNNLGAILYREPELKPVEIKKETVKINNDPVSKFWLDIFQENPAMVKRFLQPPEWWQNILNNPKFSPAQKIENIFGVKMGAGFKKLNTKSLVLGNWLYDVGEWLTKLEGYIRTGEKVAGGVANMINIFRNQPTGQQIQQQVATEMKLQDAASQIAIQGKGFFDTYGLYLLIGAIGIIFLMKK